VPSASRSRRVHFCPLFYIWYVVVFKPTISKITVIYYELCFKEHTHRVSRVSSPKLAQGRSLLGLEHSVLHLSSTTYQYRTLLIWPVLPCPRVHLNGRKLHSCTACMQRSGEPPHDHRVLICSIQIFESQPSTFFGLRVRVKHSL
jgi:hypothetical protein